ncbi:ParB/Srx family N-terminal domain-containing protein, partial [Enterococcus sp. 7D2_DIV0200]
KTSLLDYTFAENSSEWANSWIKVLKESAIQQEIFLGNKINRNKFNQFFKKFDTEFINIGKKVDTQSIQGFVNVSKVLTTFRRLRPNSLTTPTEFLLDKRYFLWQQTTDTTIKSSNLNQPILALPLIKGHTHMILDGNHRATKAILSPQETIEVIYIDRENFFLDLQFFPSKFDFYACHFVTVLHELDQVKICPGITEFIPQSFFPPQLPEIAQVEDYWRRDIFRL